MWYIYDMEILIQIAGWSGMMMVVLAYYLISHKKIDAHSKYYQLLNLLGAIGVGIDVFHQKSWSAFALQIIWGIISLTAIFKTTRNIKK